MRLSTRITLSFPPFLVLVFFFLFFLQKNSKKTKTVKTPKTPTPKREEKKGRKKKGRKIDSPSLFARGGFTTLGGEGLTAKPRALPHGIKSQSTLCFA